MQKSAVIIADAHYLTRVGLRHILAEIPTCELVGEASSETQLLHKLKSTQADIVVMDYAQPGKFSSETVEKVRQASPNARLLIISSDEDKKSIYHVLESGVNSFLSKHCGEKEIVDAVEATARNEKFYCTNVLNHLLEKSFPKEADCSPTPLSPRELDIVRLVANGLIAKEIGGKLNLSTHTVYTHRKNIMKKLKLGTVSELVRYALSEGLVG
ncbi:MAG: response regulator transcription factor [Saprospiraceae bacterium]|jgi:DNA-binding NarL/FixJ family response regulator|nr:response regulator transcription factor [Saprospiraceae bacterium]